MQWDAETLSEIFANALMSDFHRNVVRRGIVALADRKSFAEGDKSFMESLARGANKFGSLTDKQTYAGAKVLAKYIPALVEIAKAPKVEAPQPKANPIAPKSILGQKFDGVAPRKRRPRKQIEKESEAKKAERKAMFERSEKRFQYVLDNFEEISAKAGPIIYPAGY